jgi:hypothetical protein
MISNRPTRIEWKGVDMKKTTKPECAGKGSGGDYRNLCRIGGAAAIAAAALTLGEAIVFAAFPQPGPVENWFRLLQERPLIGWLDGWGLELLMYAAFVPLFLALYAALRKSDPGWMAISISTALVGIGVFFAANNPFALLSLARQHATAGAAEQAELLAAGRALLAHTGQRAVGGFNTGLFLVSIAGLIASWVMLRSAAFGKTAARAGLLANAFSLADFLRAALTDSKLAVLIMAMASVLFLTIWLAAAGRDLMRLGKARTEGGI